MQDLPTFGQTCYISICVMHGKKAAFVLHGIIYFIAFQPTVMRVIQSLPSQLTKLQMVNWGSASEGVQSMALGSLSVKWKKEAVQVRQTEYGNE